MNASLLFIFSIQFPMMISLIKLLKENVHWIIVAWTNAITMPTSYAVTRGFLGSLGSHTVTRGSPWADPL